MTLARFAIACGATPKWVLNASAALGWTLTYTVEEAAYVGLVRQLQEEVQMPLQRAAALAEKALESGAAEYELTGSITRLVIDLRRYRSDAAVRLAQAVAHHEPRRRGRRRRETSGAVERARTYGIDIGQLESSLRLTPAERLRRLDRSAEFVRDLRARRRKRA